MPTPAAPGMMTRMGLVGYSSATAGSAVESRIARADRATDPATLFVLCGGLAKGAAKGSEDETKATIRVPRFTMRSLEITFRAAKRPSPTGEARGPLAARSGCLVRNYRRTSATAQYPDPSSVYTAYARQIGFELGHGRS